MSGKFLGLLSLILLQVVIVANLQPLPANAINGLSLPFLYLVGTIGFLIPIILMVSRLAVSYPQTGGAYLWVEHAFGSKWGFIAAALLWISNLLWYPSFFSLIASNAAYVIDPAIASHKLFIISFAAILFWLVTLLNCMGIKISTRLSLISALLGILFPILLIIGCGFFWIFSGKPVAISIEETSFIPHFEFSNLGYLIAVVMSFFGIEIPAVHAGNVMNPKRDFPKSLWISGALILVLTLCASVSIALIVPVEKLSVVTGLLDAIGLFFHAFQWSALLKWIFFFILIGNIGSIMAWMLGSTRGMFVASLRNHVAPILQKTNRKEAPIGVLIFEAILFTLATFVFFAFPHISDTFWFLLVIASQVTLIYYIILFFSAIKLQRNSTYFCCIMLLGALTAFLALFFGFIPPPELSPEQASLFQIFSIIGIAIAIVLPLILLNFKRK